MRRMLYMAIDPFWSGHAWMSAGASVTEAKGNLTIPDDVHRVAALLYRERFVQISLET
jgi:hypothetical protein